MRYSHGVYKRARDPGTKQFRGMRRSGGILEWGILSFLACRICNSLKESGIFSKIVLRIRNFLFHEANAEFFERQFFRILSNPPWECGIFQS